MSGGIRASALGDRLIAAAGELALLDVREQGAYSRGHILLASNAPASRLEIEVPRLVPRRGASLVLVDETGDGPATEAAAKLRRFGYSEVSVLEGGLAAWRAAGFSVFEGVFVPSKAFGEFVEAICGTPHVSAEELAELQAEGRDLVVLDSRPLDEFQRMSIPGGIDVPGAELVHRIRDLAPDPTTLVVVNCAGRTRSIIGAQSLINAGVPNRVVALENGTMGWELAGLEPAHGQSCAAPPPSAAARAWAQAAAARVAARFGVQTIDHATLARWRDEAGERTVYLCDVRTPAEYEAGHLPGARSAPGGQLVQATDSYLGTRGARVVLVDDDGVRATMTASWLIQMGWREVRVLEGGRGAAELESGPERPEVLGLEDTAAVVTLAPLELAALLERGEEVRVLDLADSLRFRQGQVPGAWCISRARLDEGLGEVPRAPRLVLTSPDGVLARLAAAELAGLVEGGVEVLAGGTAAWRAAGLPLEEGAGRITASAADDVYLRAYDHDDPTEIEQAMRDYLRWETGLVPRLARDGTLRFATPR